MIDVTEVITLRYVIKDTTVKCYTEGLRRFGHREIQVWHLDTVSAGKLLNFICNKIINDKTNLRVDQTITDFAPVPFRIIDAILPQGEPAFQLTYERKHPAVRRSSVSTSEDTNPHLKNEIICDRIDHTDLAELG